MMLYKSLSQYFDKTKLDNNEFVINSSLINPNATSPEIIDRIMEIKFNAEVDNSLNWDFKAMQDTIKIKVGDYIFKLLNE